MLTGNNKSSASLPPCPGTRPMLVDDLTSGGVHMPVDDALTDEDKADNYILACQAEISGDVAVDA